MTITDHAPATDRNRTIMSMVSVRARRDPDPADLTPSDLDLTDLDLTSPTDDQRASDTRAVWTVESTAPSVIVSVGLIYTELYIG
jgi:hypothetical protein